ncbi:MAG: hypothetical protein HQ523_13175 [Lentisphaerae bacterium]|nr:hypothetical protein [Lentisphaerota bacterium]
MMSNRGYASWYPLYTSSHHLPAWWGRLNHIYNQALPHMQGRRRLLPNSAGIRWENKAGDLIWTHRDWRPGKGATFARLSGKKEIPWTKPVLESGNVYRSL